MCNLGSLNYSLASPLKSIQNNNFWQQNDNGGEEDDMCLIDDDNFLTLNGGETGPILENNSDMKKVTISYFSSRVPMTGSSLNYCLN